MLFAPFRKTSELMEITTKAIDASNLSLLNINSIYPKTYPHSFPSPKATSYTPTLHPRPQPLLPTYNAYKHLRSSNHPTTPHLLQYHSTLSFPSHSRPIPPNTRHQHLPLNPPHNKSNRRRLFPSQNKVNLPLSFTHLLSYHS